jgi:uncharacterized protein YsxB (DUF464 family)
MIEIKLFEDKESKRFLGLVVSGHANYAAAGSDVVCAAVSAITQTAVLGIMNITSVTEGLIRKDGYMKYTVPINVDKAIKEKVDAILETMFLGLDNLREEYSQYINIRKLEV